jgi:hypothetical protein
VANNENAAADGRGPNWGLVAAIVGLVVLLIVVLALSSVIQIVGCDNYLAVKLIYPILFGAVGVVLGGQIKLDGKLEIFNVPWAGHLTGGIAAALLGFAITVAAAPTCDARHKLSLAVLNWPIRDSHQSRHYYTTVEIDEGVRVDVDNVSSAGSRYDFVFGLPDKNKIQLTFRVFKQDGRNYTEMQSCTLAIRKLPLPDADKNKTIYKLSSGKTKLEVQYDDAFFGRLESPPSVPTDKDSACLIGRGNAKDRTGPVSIVSPIYLVDQPSALGPLGRSGRYDMFVVLNTPTDESAIARVEERELPADTTVPAPTQNPAPALPPAAKPQPAPAPPPPAQATSTERPQPAPAPSAQSSAPPAPPPAPVPVRRTETPAPCTIADSVKKEVDDFVGGTSDLDPKTRRDIYGNWLAGAHCYVWPMIANDSTVAAVQARALRLLNFALKNVDESWQLTSNIRRDFSRDPKPLMRVDFQRIFELAQADDDGVRAEAAGIIRYYPVNSFERLFDEAQLNVLPAKRKERLAVAATYMYYNRITENLTGPVDKPAVKASVAKEFDRAQKWTADSLFTGKTGKPFKAMLLYGRAAVERWALEDTQTKNFAAMLDVLRTTSEAYPLRYHHIGQALAIVQAPEQNRQKLLEDLKKIDDYPASTHLGSDTSFKAARYDLYAGPDEKYGKINDRLEDKTGARMLLHSGDWVLIHATQRIGWIRRVPST